MDAAQHFGRPISEFMTPQPETLDASQKIAFALHKMDLGVTHLLKHSLHDATARAS